LSIDGQQEVNHSIHASTKHLMSCVPILHATTSWAAPCSTVVKIVLLCCVPADAVPEDKPVGKVAGLIGLGALFAGWYLANIYFNM
jgi:hypothetical protein